MRKKCELCDSPAKLFCDSDQASLCWSCDSKVHSANFLVAKHQRTLLCNLCQSVTPWTASGPKLTPTASVCGNCVADSSCRDEIGNGRHTNSDEDDDRDGGEDDSGESEDDRSGGGGGGDEDEENQVVPAPPAASSSSNSDQESYGLIESSSIGEIASSFKSSALGSQKRFGFLEKKNRITGLQRR